MYRLMRTIGVDIKCFYCASLQSTTLLKANVQNFRVWPLANVNSQPFASSFSTSTVTELDEPDELYKQMVIEVKGHDTAVLNSYEKFLMMAAKELGIIVSKTWTPPRVIERLTLLKSVHIYKKHRVQYETRTMFRAFEIKHITGCTADVFLEYIQRNLPEGMAMKVTKHKVEALPDHLHPPSTTT